MFHFASLVWRTAQRASGRECVYVGIIVLFKLSLYYLAKYGPIRCSLIVNLRRSYGKYLYNLFCNNNNNKMNIILPEINRRCVSQKQQCCAV